MNFISDWLWSLNSWLPGIWAPDWSQFIPDVVNTLIIGLLASAIVARAQRSSFAKATRAATLRDWRRLQLRLRPYFALPREQTSSIVDWAEPFSPMLADLENEPIQEWAEAINDPALAALIRLESNLTAIRATWRSTYELVASTAENRVRSAQLLTNRAPQQVNTVTSHAIARLLGKPFTTQHFAQACQESGMSVEEGDDLISGVMSTPAVREAVAAYDQRVRQAVADARSIENKLAQL